VIPDDNDVAAGERDEHDKHDNWLTEVSETMSGSHASDIPESITPDEALGALRDFARFVIERIKRSGKKIVITVIEEDVHEFHGLLRMAELAIDSNDLRVTPR